MNITIPYQDTGYFSRLILDYVAKQKKVSQLYHRPPEIAQFEKQIQEKQSSFADENREVLVKTLLEQYQKVDTTQITLQNIELLKESNTFTITTGHQLNLFTGPLYFFYKIVSTINLCKELKKHYPNHHFVPIYWMATEDHDFEEINFFRFEGVKYQWNKNTQGPVGRIDTQGLKEVYHLLKQNLKYGNNAKYLDTLFEAAYVKNNNLADATRYLVNELFQKEGLVIVDADNKQLKKLFASYIKEELVNQSSKKEVEKTFNILKDYSIQVNPREINLFYIENELRERIIYQDETYKILNTSKEYSKEEILNQVEKNPEKFSPNVILRPLYQEVILPNLCYIGGGGEIAYWLQLKEVFQHHHTPFPILLLRNSALLVTEKENIKREKLQLSWQELFEKKEKFVKEKTLELSAKTFDFAQQKKFLEEQFLQLANLVKHTHPSFEGAVKAQEQKQLKGIENLEKRYLKAERLKHKETLDRMLNLKEQLFPNGNLQERVENFATYYTQYGNYLIEKMIEELNPLEQKFKIILL